MKEELKVTIIEMKLNPEKAWKSTFLSLTYWIFLCDINI